MSTYRTAAQTQQSLDTAAQAVREYLGSTYHSDGELDEIGRHVHRQLRQAMTIDGHTAAAIAARAGIRQLIVAQMVDDEHYAAALAGARHDAERYLADVMAAIRRRVLADVGGGMAEAEAARRYGITRMTVRAWRTTNDKERS